MDEIVNNILLAGDKFMPEMHLRQQEFTYCGCRPFTKNKEKIQKFKGTGDLRYIFQNKVDKASIQDDKVYGYFKDLIGRIASDKTFNIAKNAKYDGYQRDLASMVYKFFDKKTSGSGIKNENISSKELAEDLHKPIIRKFNKINVQ